MLLINILKIYIRTVVPNTFFDVITANSILKKIAELIYKREICTITFHLYCMRNLDIFDTVLGR